MTSLFEGVASFDTGKWSSDSPVDSLIYRTVLNNLEHLSDESAQVLVNSPCVTTGNGIVRATETDRFSTIKSWGPLSFRVRGDGESYRIRWRARMRLQSAGSAEIYFVLHPARTAPEDHIFAGFERNYDQLTLTSTSIGWVTPDNDWPLYLDPRMVERCIHRRSTARDLGGDAIDVTIHEMLFSVISAETTSSLDVEINGFYAAEFVGT